MEDSADGQALRDAADSASVSIGFGDEWVDDRSVRHVADPVVLRTLLARRGPSWPRHDGVGLANELAQYEAARSLGVPTDDLTFRVRTRRSKPAGSFTRRRFVAGPELLVRYSGPKLAVASIYAAAPVPTTFDLARLAEFGYRDVAHVAERIAAWNDNDRVPRLPLLPTA